MSEKNINKLHTGGKKMEDMQPQAEKKKGSQETRIHVKREQTDIKWKQKTKLS